MIKLTRDLTTLGLALAYLSTIVLANALIVRYGLIPVGLGQLAPAGVYMAGLALTLRDGLQERGGRRWVLAAILIGAGLSAQINGPLALASGAAFLVSELADFAVYTPLRRRGWLVAVLASNAVGAVVDSALFLWLAFGSLDLIAGQLLGKAWATLIAVALTAAWRWAARRRRRARARRLLRLALGRGFGYDDAVAHVAGAYGVDPADLPAR